MRPLAAIVFISTGLFFLYFGGRSAYIGIASLYWATVEGRVLSSSVKSEAGKRGGLVYSAEVNYAYAVNDKSFTSQRIRFGNINTGNPMYPTHLVDKYPASSSVTVYYSASDPSVAVLEPGIQTAAWVVLGIGALFGGVGVAAIFLPANRYERRRRRMA
jgi:hypothetical protein